MSLWSRTSAVLALGGVALLIQSCGGFGTICKAQISCEGGNSNDEARCEDGYKGEENVASDAKCSAQWSDYWSCYEDHAACQGNKKFDDAGVCGKLRMALTSCQAPVEVQF
jgi:hypothetical protein